MAYKFVEKKNVAQEEMAYIIYMIVGSYFNKVRCRNAFAEKRLYLYYMEMKNQAQEAKEKKVIREAEKVLGDFEEVLGEMNCEVFFGTAEDELTIDFVTGFEQVHVVVDKKGNYDMQVL